MITSNKTFDLYGFREPTISVVQNKIEDALGVHFMQHESSYLGVYFRCGLAGEEHLVLRSNFNVVEAEWTEGNFQEFPTLLFVNESTRAKEIQAMLCSRIPRTQLLRRTNV